MSKLDAGMTSAELLKEEYLSEQDDNTDTDLKLSEDSTEELTEEIADDIIEEESEENSEDTPEIKPWPILNQDEDQELDDFQNAEDPDEAVETEPKSFTIPKLNIEGLEEGSLDIPVINPAGAAAIPGAVSAVADPVLHAAEALDKASWQPPTLEDTEEIDEVDLKEASQMIADVNDFLQKEIDRLTLGNEQISAQVPEPVDEDIILPEIKLPEIKMPDEIEEEFDEPLTEAYDEPEEPLTEEIDLDVVSQEDQEFFDEDEEEEIPEDSVPDINISDIELPPIELPQDILEDTGVEPIQSEPVFAPEPIPLPQSVMADPLPEVTQVTLDEPIAPVAPVVSPAQVANTANTAANASGFELEDEDLAIFSYFLPITGMKKSIAQAITGAATHLAQAGSKGGSIAIIGEPGSGKTQMATSIIKVLEKKTGYPKGGIGKISGEKLNEKDIQKLYSKIQGGCLIIEAAGGISKETAVTLSLLMEQDNSGTIIIIEDNKKGIEKALLRDGSFAKRFTEKVVIPVFSIDELVSFAKTYAMEAGCTIDDMGVLALYNRINLIGRYDHATTIKEVAEIMDEAIDKSTRGGFFNKPKYDKNGNIILKEKDFDR
jgi:energy-coupling factor transporter ATP-binding protein EcfA2